MGKFFNQGTVVKIKDYLWILYSCLWSLMFWVYPCITRIPVADITAPAIQTTLVPNLFTSTATNGPTNCIVPEIQEQLQTDQLTV